MTTSHHTHDPDLVAGLAAGWIDDEAERRTAEDLVATCEACRQEHELHAGVSAWLAGDPAPRLTEAERAALRSGVRSGTARPGQVVILGERRGRPSPSTVRWTRLGAVAAALVVVAGVGGVLAGGLGGVDDAGIATEAAVDTMQADGVTDLTEAMRMDESDAADADESATAMQAEEAEEAPMADSAGGDAAAAEAVPIVVEDPTDHSAEQLAARIDSFLAELTASSARRPLTAEEFSAREAPTPECFTTEVEPAFGVLLTGLEGRPVQVFAVEDGAGGLTPLVLDPQAACSPVDLP